MLRSCVLGCFGKRVRSRNPRNAPDDAYTIAIPAEEADNNNNSGEILALEDAIYSSYSSSESLATSDDLDSKPESEMEQLLHEIELVTNTSAVAVSSRNIELEEEAAFARWINSNLSSDPDLAELLPVKLDSGDLYRKTEGGYILCKLINLAVPGTVDERAICKASDNMTLALTSAQAIGCNIRDDNHDLLELLWQIIRIRLFNKLNLIDVPGLFRLLGVDETGEEQRRLSPEDILMRWVNYHLENAGVDRRLRNFDTDIMDSEIYAHHLHQIAPREAAVTLSPLTAVGNVDRAGAMLCEAEKLDCREFLTPNDVANGNAKLNLAFIANLFNKHPNLPEPIETELVQMEPVVEETREEKTYRNWMNSMGVSPCVHWLYSDLSDGLIVFQLYDMIQPGIVNWARVARVFKKLSGMMDAIQNHDYALELGRQLGFSLVGIQGKDIYDGNRKLTLALVWQLMRAYTLTILAQCTQSGDALPADKDIVEWVNQKLESSGKQSRIESFQDSSISNAKVVLDLVDTIKPGVIDWRLVRDNSMDNAKYAITCARKIGAKVYALPEDIVEVKHKMVLTVFACLMARDFMPKLRDPVASSIQTA